MASDVRGIILPDFFFLSRDVEGLYGIYLILSDGITLLAIFTLLSEYQVIKK